MALHLVRAVPRPVDDPRDSTPDITPEALALEAMTEKQRAVTRDWLGLVRAVRGLMQVSGMKRRAACEHLAQQMALGRTAPAVREAGLRLGRGGLPVSWQSLDRQVKAYESGGVAALAPRHKGRQRKAWGWEMRARHLWQQPTQPAMSTVALWLREEGQETATDARVRAYLSSIPAAGGTLGPKRLGAHYVAQNVRRHKVRDYSDVPVGLVWEGDGHTCDVYVEHPETGHSFRPELTVWIDWRSNYPVAWLLTEAESATTTLYSLGRGMAEHDHVPSALHVDPGSGFINRMITDEVTGFLAKLDIEAMKALPGNAKGKGKVEGFFRWFEERLGKQYPSFCGHVRTDDGLRRMQTRIQRGELIIPTLAQYSDAVDGYMQRYRERPQDGLDGQSPAQLWALLERNPLHMSIESLVAIRERAKVRREVVQRWGRTYGGPDLGRYNGQWVMVEANLRDMRRVQIRDEAGRWLCDATQVAATPALPDDHLQVLKRKRLDGQRKRLQRHLEEAEARAGMAITHQEQVDDMRSLGEPERANRLAEQDDDAGLKIDLTGVGAPARPQAEEGEIDLDLLDTTYADRRLSDDDI
jgi:putative transposase